MKKVLLALMLILATANFASCTNDDDQDEIELLTIDKDKQECTGCDDNNG